MSIEREDLTSSNRCDDLAFWYCAHIANALREYEVGLERLDGVDIDLVHAAVVPQRRADGRINLTARQPFKVGSWPGQPRAASDAGRVIAAVRNPDEPALEP